MARTRAVLRRRPNINFQQRGNIDFGRVVRKMIVRRVAKHAAKKKNVRYG